MAVPETAFVTTVVTTTVVATVTATVTVVTVLVVTPGQPSLPATLVAVTPGQFALHFFWSQPRSAFSLHVLSSIRWGVFLLSFSFVGQLFCHAVFWSQPPLSLFSSSSASIWDIGGAASISATASRRHEARAPRAERATALNRR